MHKVMSGVRVLEVAQFTFVPAAGAVLADWGADVIKVEHPVTGDAQRGLGQMGVLRVGGGPNVNPLMEHSNRGKRSIGLDIATDAGRAVLYELAKTSDVFLTNFLPDARRRLRIDLEDIRAHNPKIIYVRGTALGEKGPEREHGGYDMSAYWCRAGSAAAATPSDVDGTVTQPGPGYGDSIGGMTIAGGIAGALFARERSGEPSVVDVSLLGVGVWSMGLAIDLTMLSGHVWRSGPAAANNAPSNPLVGTYRTSDNRFVNVVMLQAFRYWPDFCRHIERPDLISDARFDSAEKLAANSQQAAQVVREVLATKTLAEWSKIFATLEGQWAPVQNTAEIANDPQVRANGYIATVETGEGSTFELVTNPVHFDGQPPALTRGPAFAEHTEQLLLEAGYDWEKIARLKEQGVVA
jgi:crotonobetainyl-CoA:carnitine CoA-transferase CaiB-like acyl-CoA transferase